MRPTSELSRLLAPRLLVAAGAPPEGGLWEVRLSEHHSGGRGATPPPQIAGQRLGRKQALACREEQGRSLAGTRERLIIVFIALITTAAIPASTPSDASSVSAPTSLPVPLAAPQVLELEPRTRILQAYASHESIPAKASRGPQPPTRAKQRAHARWEPSFRFLLKMCIFVLKQHKPPLYLYYI